ncbi:MAG: hypothetical protein SV760_08335, partial [Halobacteria archaeon]|nr:hypothetical protein [Halobacteria archaeon]
MDLLDGESTESDLRLLDGCERLYSRKIDGFSTLDQFVERMVSSDAVVVTSWNLYSWRYLTQVKGIDDCFDEVVELERLDFDGVVELLRAEYGDEVPETDRGDSDGVDLFENDVPFQSWFGSFPSV